MIAVVVVLVKPYHEPSIVGKNMATLNDLNELASLLIQAHEVSERADSAHIKLLIEATMYELGRLIAQQDVTKPDVDRKKLN
jgi:hypothetical protein